MTEQDTLTLEKAIAKLQLVFNIISLTHTPKEPEPKPYVDAFNLIITQARLAQKYKTALNSVDEHSVSHDHACLIARKALEEKQ